MTNSPEFKEEIQRLFPTTVLIRRHPNEHALNQSLLEWLLGVEKQYSQTPANASRTGRITTQGGFQTPMTMNIFELNHPDLTDFRDRILLPAARAYLDAVFGKEAKALNPYPVGWSNLLRANDWQRPHMHPTENNVISGVYYIHMPPIEPPEGCIEFLNPNPISTRHGFSMHHRLVPEEGMLVLFPPWYIHYVHPMRHENTRAVLAFDVMAQRQRMEFVF